MARDTVCYRFDVEAIDEFGRKFGNSYFNVTSKVIWNRDSDFRTLVTHSVFHKLVWEILREMGHAAKAEWTGSTMEWFDDRTYF